MFAHYIEDCVLNPKLAKYMTYLESAVTNEYAAWKKNREQNQDQQKEWRWKMMWW